MDAHVPEQVGAYVNLGKFLFYRNYQLSSEPLRPSHVQDIDLVSGLTPSEVVDNVLRTIGNWAIVATQKGDSKQVMVIFLITAESRPAHATQELRRLLASAEQRAEGRNLREVIVLAPESVVAKKNLSGLVAQFNKDAGAGQRYFMYPYCKFADVVPESPQVPRHEVVALEEAQEYMRKFHLEPGQLPKIHTRDDAAAIWCGARPGNYVRVWRISETAGSEVPILRFGV